MSTLLVALKPGTLTEDQLKDVEEAARGMRVVVTRERARIEEDLPEIRVALGMFPHDLVSRAERLEWLQLWSAGADSLLRRPEVMDSDVVITNSAGVHAVPISEHVFAYLLAFARGMHRAVRDQVAGRWQAQREADLFELYDKTMLIVGAGHIGARIAALGDAFGMRVIAVRRDATRPVPGAAEVHATEALDELLPTADFVVSTAPLTPETRGMFGARQFAAMRSSAYLVNIGRGGTIEETHLVAALRSGQIAGAGLDVFEQEPLPADSPLWGMDNVIITSHYAGATPRYAERVLEIFLDNLRRFQAGEELRNVVDRRLGY